MTGMVQTDLAHPPAPKYKDEPVEDPHRHPGPQPPHLHHPRPTLLVQPQKQPESPHQPSTTLPSGSYAPHALGNGVIHHQHSYGPPSEQSYYSSHSSYSTASAPSQYSSSGPPEMMAAATQMQRPYPPIYHTPQSSSPASVASQTHEQHNRGIYTQSPQMASQMYGYPPYSPMNPVQPPPYGPNTSPQQHQLTTQPLMVPHPTSTAQLPHHPAQAPTGNLPSSPNSAAAQQPTPPQRTMLNPPHSAASGAPLSASAVHHQNSNVGASSSAAPGPIPATTPLVVRQDSNGVQWIAFEYSRDRVKMEYTIRCDVESVNVDNLSQEFKTENCVYPRACCSKDQYRGNRLVYETECNAVGWALAELNPALRGKRGLIQRAVDSWRNSNQDPRLRSRRVRRMAKINKRQAMPVPPPHMAPSTPVGPGVPSASMPAPGPRPSLGPLPMGPPQLHHHHAQPDGSAGHEEASGATDYTNGTSRPPVSDGLQPGPSPTDIRTAQVFHGYPSYPTPATASGGPRGPSIPPLLRDSGIGSLGRHPTIATSSNRIEEVDDDDDERNPSSDALFGTLPEGKRRKFILVDDNQRGCRVRVKVMLDQVDMDEIPDSYRLSNAVYPRTYFPVQMRDPGRVVPGNRYVKDNTGAEESEDEDEDMPPRRVMVPAPRIDGEGEIAVPRLSRGRRRREVLLNDLGYRMSWSQSRVFAGRMLFLQRSLDAYRNKMRSTMLAAGQDPTAIPRHFETRAGKRRFLERRRRAAGGPTRGAGAHGVSASQRSAEEVEA